MSRPLLLDLNNHDQPALIDQADAELVDAHTFYLGKNGYVYYSTWEDGKSTPHTLHQLLIGPTPGKHIDHWNRDKLDNRRENLRVVTYQQNQVNRAAKPMRGLTYRPDLRRPWVAQITVNRKNIYLGAFSTIEDAVAARQTAELSHYGELCPR